MKRTALHRRTPMRRSGLSRTGRLRPVNAARRRAETLRAFGPPERRAWVQAQPSVASGRRPCVNAHVGTGGTSRRADARFIVPLTWDEHEEAHRIGERAFETKYEIDLAAAAAETERRWNEHLAHA